MVLLFCMALLSGTVMAQKEKITWSPEFKEANGDIMGSILYDDGENVYMYVRNKKRGEKGITPGIMKLDSKMKAVHRQDFKASAEEVRLIDIFYCGGKFIMLTHKYEKETNTSTVYGSSIGLPNLEVSGESVELWKVSAPLKRDFSISVMTSNDTTLFALRTFVEQKKNEKQMFAFKVYDGSFKEVHEKTIKLDYTEDQYDLKGITLSNDGTVTYFAKRYASTSKKETTRGDNREKQASYTLNIMKYAKDGSEKEYNVELGNKLMDNLAVATDPVSSDIMMIITHTDVKQKQLTGYDFLRISSTSGDVLSKKSHTFPQQLVEKMRLTEKPFIAEKNTSNIPKTFNVHEMHATADGRVYLVLENTFSITRSSRNSSYTVHYANGLLAMMFDLEGNVKWNAYIPKNQWYRSTYGYLYPTIAYSKDKISIFYNDHIKNLAFDINNYTKRPAPFNSLNEMLLVRVDISNEGKVSRKVVQQSEKDGVPVKAYNCLQGSGDRFILYGETFKDNRCKIGVHQL